MYGASTIPQVQQAGKEITSYAKEVRVSIDNGVDSFLSETKLIFHLTRQFHNRWAANKYVSTSKQISNNCEPCRTFPQATI